LGELADGGPGVLDPEHGGEDSEDEAERGGAREVEQRLGAYHPRRHVGRIEDGDREGRLSLLDRGRGEPIVNRLDEDAADRIERTEAAAAIRIIVGNVENRG